MKMINLTPHDLYIVDADGNHKATVPPSGTVARVAVRRVEVGDIDGIPLYKAVYGSPEGLPEPASNTIYIVSGLFRAAVPERGDVWQPGELLRNEAGQVIGCVGLQR
jgi:hypothetical protein